MPIIATTTVENPAWDLSFVIKRLTSKEKLPPELALRAVEEYRKFLVLCKELPATELCVAGLVDVAWHSHILHTKRYADFCARELGYFLHHSPVAQGDGRPSCLETMTLVADRFGTVDKPIWQPLDDDPDYAAACSVDSEADCGKREA
ncbi:MAG: hypothetical protein EKK41_19610 [Hyphomicrobiales bacterium]|nr:MAG: hypothetical protein EKK41_19610 [Hyphomicrobiales bacterium]